MADETTRVVDLPVKATSNISLADYLMGIDAAEGYQMLIGDLARKIIETYTDSSLAGSAQTIKAALDGLNTKVGNASMGTTATSVTGAIAEHESDINGTNGINSKIGNTAMGTTATTLTGAVKEHNDKIGSTTMGTTATTLTGAIAEHEEDISELNSKTNNVTYGTITWNTANVTGDNNRRYYWKLGRMVIVSCEFTPNSGKIATGNVIASDLPRPISNFDRYFISGGNSQQVCIGNDGTLQWYFPLDTATLQRIDLQIVYFAAE